MKQFFTLWLYCIIICVVAQEKQEEWGYVTVRPGAHMFWWLYRSPTDWQNKPLVMWLQVRNCARAIYWCILTHVYPLQGGPGASSTGFGNFIEIGPLDINLQPRPTTWVWCSLAWADSTHRRFSIRDYKRLREESLVTRD